METNTSNVTNDSLHDVLENLKSQPPEYWFDSFFKEYVFKHYEPEEGSPLDTVNPSEKREEAYDQWLEPNVTQDLSDLLKTFSDWLKGDPKNQPLPKPDDFLYPPDESDLGYRRPAPNSDVNDNWNDGKNWTPPRVDPLVLDLDGDGIETLGVNATTHVVFDGNSDGLKTGTGWIKGDDGFLVLDRNGNGTIDNGGELFGDQTLVNGVKAANGLEALKAEDTNTDGVFDANDTNYTNVRVWQDTNGDGISQSSELHTLTELGIASINLTYTGSGANLNGNTQTATGTFTKTDGTTGTAANLNFAQNHFYREFTDHLTLTDTARTLPDMQGNGMVRDLREASTLSAGLTSTLQSMSTTYETHDQMMAQIDTLLAEWAGTSSMATTRERANRLGGDAAYVEVGDQILYHKYLWATQHNNFSIMNADERIAAEAIAAKVERLGNIMDILERFNGENMHSNVDTFESFFNNGRNVQVNTVMNLDGYSTASEWSFVDPCEVSLSSVQINFFEQSYTALKESVYDSLVLQTRLSGYLDAINLIIDENGIHIDDSAMIQMIIDKVTTDPANALRDTFELRKYAGLTLGMLGWDGDSALSKVLAETGTYDATSIFAEYGMIVANGSYSGTNADENIWGKGGNDVIDAGDGDDTVHGGDGNDSITSGSGNDTLFGGSGDDILSGGAGDDTYHFSRGDGYDTIYDFSTVNNGGNDTVIFDRGINENDLLFNVEDNNLIIHYTENDQVTIRNFFNNDSRIETFKLFNGTSIIPTITAALSENADNFNYETIDNYLVHGGDGNDSITVGSGNDILYGDSGDDTINAGVGNDTLIGGIGNDILNGGTGSDTYIFNRGDGQDQIIDSNLNHSVKFHGGSDQLSTTKIVTTALTGQQVSVSFDMNWDGTNTIMPVGFLSYDLFLYNGMFGFNTGNSDLYGIGNTTRLIGTNHTITAVFTQGDVSKNKLYIDGVEQTLTQQLGSPNNARADITQEFNISGCDLSSGYRFSGNIDNVQLHNRALTATETGTIANGKIVSSGMVALYDFEGPNPYSDKSGNGHNIILSGSPSIQTISSSNTSTTELNTVQFGIGIGARDIAFYKNGSNLLLSYGVNDLITITNQSNTNNTIEKFTLSDGNFLTSNDLNVIIQSMNAYATDHGISISSLDSVKNNQDLMNIVASGWHQ